MPNNDLISRAAAIAEIEEYIEEYSELEPETGFHSLKWCAMEEAKDTLLMLPPVDAIPVEWLIDRANDHERAPLYRRYAQMLYEEWQRGQEART